MSASPQLKTPVIVTPSGEYIEITPEVVEAVKDFRQNKHTGSVQIQFRDGGIAGVEASYKKSFSKKQEKCLDRTLNSGQHL